MPQGQNLAQDVHHQSACTDAQCSAVKGASILNHDAPTVRLPRIPTADTRVPLASVEELLSPEHLSLLLGRTVNDVQTSPLEGASAHSGSALSRVDVSARPRDLGEAAVQAVDEQIVLVLKRVSPAWDYFMRATDDVQGREAQVWLSGVLDRMPDSVGHAPLAVAHDGDGGWAILMRDVGAALLLHRQHQHLSVPEHDAIILGLAEMHATFWDAPELTAHADWLTRPDLHYRVISPAMATRHADVSGPMPPAIHRGWDNVRQLLPAPLADALRALTDDPAPLMAALAPLPQTLVHGDARISNVGVEPWGDGTRLLLIDWAIAGVNVSGLDLIWYLGARSPWLPADREQAIEDYRNHLAELLGERWQPQHWAANRDLSILGGLIRFGWFTASEAARGSQAARDDLFWWAERAEPGLALLR